MNIQTIALIFFLFLSLLSALFSQEDLLLKGPKIPNENLFLNKALNTFYKKNYLASYRILNDYLNEKDNQDFWARYYLGLSLYKLGLVDEALKEWQNIITLGLNKEPFFRARINQLYSQGNEKNFIESRSFIKKKEIPAKEEIISLKIPLGLSINEQQKLFFLEFKTGNFYKANLNGSELTLINKISENFLPILRNPWDAYFSQGQWVVSDFGNDRLALMTSEGKLISTLGKRGNKPGELLGPKGLHIDKAGNIYVAESGNSRIQVFNKNESLFTFGKLGTGAGEFLQPNSIWVDDEKKKIYVLDNGNRRIQVFNLQGKYLLEWGSDFLKNPLDFLIKDEKMFILDQQQIFSYDLENQEIVPLLKPLNSLNDYFLSFTLDSKNNNFYVANSKNNKIEIFSSLKSIYKNLNILIENLWSEKFPKMLLKVSVKNEKNQPITFLKKSNFKVFENNQKVFHQLEKISPNKKFIFLVEKSVLAEKQIKKLENFLEQFFNNKKANDLVKIISFGEENQSGYLEKTHFNNLKLFSINKATEKGFGEPMKINGALKKSIDTLITYLEKKAIIILTHQNLSLNSFKDVTTYKQITFYAKNNNIPIYVFYLGNEKKQPKKDFSNLLFKLTQDSGGNYYYFNNSKVIKKFYQHFNKNLNNQYYLSYKTAPNPLRKGKLRRVQVEVDFLGRKGIEKFILYPIP